MIVLIVAWDVWYDAENFNWMILNFKPIFFVK